VTGVQTCALPISNDLTPRKGIITAGKLKIIVS
jgi:hypothetical protein